MEAYLVGDIEIANMKMADIIDLYITALTNCTDDEAEFDDWAK